jgi:hypothetical protein
MTNAAMPTINDRAARQLRFWSFAVTGVIFILWKLQKGGMSYMSLFYVDDGRHIEYAV